MLPAFPGGKSHGLSFSPGDVLASAVLHRLTQSCGVPTGQLKDVSTGIFDVYHETRWDILADCVLVVNLAHQPLGGYETASKQKSGHVPA